jgi:phosphohistidine phosphatase
MKTLLLLRHGKSRWDSRGVPDHERPLKARGKRDAKRVGRLLAQRQLTPEHVLSSTAKRARGTAKRTARTCQYAGEIDLLAELYMAQPPAWLDALRLLPDDAERVLIVGHNPGLEELLGHLTDEVEPLTTAALARIALPLERWSDLNHATRGKLIDVWRPKKLKASRDSIALASHVGGAS